MKILVAGDFVPQYRVAVQIDEGNYSCLDEVKPCVDSMDYAIVNLESPVVSHVAKPIEKTGPNLRCTEKAMDCLLNAGFNCVTLANNHFRDYGQVGVDDTISTCEKYGIDYVGGGKNLSEAKTVLYKDINGERLAIINICENEWSIAGENYGGSAPLNPVSNYYAIQEARKQADFVLLIVHGGIEGYQYPTPRMQETYRFFIDSGADSVVNHHQHCYSGYEEYNGKPIFYGLGNFCFDRKGQHGSVWNEGYCVLLDFNGEAVSYQIFPYTQCKETPATIPMKGNQTDIFNNKIVNINTIINSQTYLKQQFEQYLKQVSQFRLMNLEPIYNRFYRVLQNKGILPKLISGVSLRDWFDRLNCESHRDVLCPLMKEKVEKTNKIITY